MSSPPLPPNVLVLHPLAPRPAWVASDAPHAWPTDTAELAALRTRATVDPARLFEFAHAAQLRTLQALARPTQVGYASDWAGFVSACGEMGFAPLPAAPPAVEAFIELCAPLSAELLKLKRYRYVLPEAPRRDHSAATIQRAVAAIGAVHRWLNLPDPTAHPDVGATLKLNLEPQPDKQPKDPLSFAMIERALPTYGTSLPELRAQAVVLVGWSTLLRRSELVARARRDWQPTPEGDDGLLRVTRTKGKKRLQERYVIAPARAALETWLDAAGLTAAGIAEDHPLFPRLNRFGVVSRQHPKALHPGEVNLIYKDVARRAGLSELEVQRIAGHSSRIGATHALGANRASLPQIQLAGGWDSPQQPARYLRQQAAREGAMAQWARDQGVGATSCASRSASAAGAPGTPPADPENGRR